MQIGALVKSIPTTIAIAVLIGGCSPSEPESTTAQDSEAEGLFKFEAGYPTPDASQALYDEMDYQRAVQAYIWATPLLNSMGWRAGLARFGVTEHNHKFLVWQYSILPQHVVMTANQVTPYAWALMDLKKDGPMVVVVPPNDVLGGFCDFWQRALEDLGAPGPDRGKGGKYLILPPGYEGDVPDGYFVVRSTSNLTWVYARANGAKFKGDAAFDVYGNLRLYPLSKADNPPTNVSLVPVGKKAFNGDWPKGYEAWSLIHEGMQLDNIRDQDKIIYDFLKGLGLRHGEPFAPNDRQKKILARAAQVGGKMVANLAFANRNDFAVQWPDRQWVSIFAVQTRMFETDTYVEVTDRASGWYQLVMSGKYPFDARKRAPIYGTGSAYLASYRDGSAAFLNGSNNYRLKVPANVPIANFWSVTVYDNQTRSMIVNDEARVSRGSPDELAVNDDGSIDLYFGPMRPEGSGSNWVQTNPNEGWFVLFRFFGPEREYYDKSWKLPDFQKIN
jgi:hypothetical protein